MENNKFNNNYSNENRMNNNETRIVEEPTVTPVVLTKTSFTSKVKNNKKTLAISAGVVAAGIGTYFLGRKLGWWGKKKKAEQAEEVLEKVVEEVKK